MQQERSPLEITKEYAYSKGYEFLYVDQKTSLPVFEKKGQKFKIGTPNFDNEPVFIPIIIAVTNSNYGP